MNYILDSNNTVNIKIQWNGGDSKDGQYSLVFGNTLKPTLVINKKSGLGGFGLAGARFDGGSVIFVDGIYYWYGENKEKTLGNNDIWHWGVRCYSSIDLYNWEDKGLIIEPNLEDENCGLCPNSMMDRPHIIYNKATNKFVCWLKIMGDGCQTETVLTADNILGPYKIVREGLKSLGMSAGDFDLVVAEDGKAYYYFERVHSETICVDLTDDYTDVTGYYSTPFPKMGPPYAKIKVRLYIVNFIGFILDIPSIVL